jgi:hypothetical protein
MICAICGTLVSIGSLLLFGELAAHHDRITQANFDRLTLGMTLMDVERVFGGPQGFYTDVPCKLFTRGDMPPSLKEWYGWEGIAFLEFDREDRLTKKYYHVCDRRSASMGYRVLQQIKSYYHRLSE